MTAPRRAIWFRRRELLPAWRAGAQTAGSARRALARAFTHQPARFLPIANGTPALRCDDLERESADALAAVTLLLRARDKCAAEHALPVFEGPRTSATV